MIIDARNYLDHKYFIDSYLAHHGVKGMKWGVRKEQRARNMIEVGEMRRAGKPVSLGKHARAAYEVALNPRSLGAAIKQRNVSQAALEKGKRIEARIASRKRGELSVAGKMAYYSNMRFQDLLPTQSSPTDTKAKIGASIAGVLLSTVTFPIGSIPAGTAIAGAGATVPVIKIPLAGASAAGLATTKLGSKLQDRRARKVGK